jgi:small-conductance mechanosensitive channel
MPEEPQKPGIAGHYRRELDLARQLSARAVRRARAELVVLGVLFLGVILLFDNRVPIFGQTTAARYDTPIRTLTVVVLVILGWWLARDVGRGLGPALLRHMDAAAAGTAGFVIRLFTVAATIIIASLFAGIDPSAVAVGGAFTAVIFGLAAQQTLGNLIAGTVLLSARPFRVGERVRLQGAPGQIEGVVSSLGLLYTTFADGDDQVMVPNSVVLNSAVTPLREPPAVNLRARLRGGVTPDDLERLIEAGLTTALRSRPEVTVVELDGDEVVVEITATPQSAADGGKLASELLEIVSGESSAGEEDSPADAPDSPAVAPDSPDGDANSPAVAPDSPDGDANSPAGEAPDGSDAPDEDQPSDGRGTASSGATTR